MLSLLDFSCTFCISNVILDNVMFFFFYISHISAMFHVYMLLYFFCHYHKNYLFFLHLNHNSYIVAMFHVHIVVYFLFSIGIRVTIATFKPCFMFTWWSAHLDESQVMQLYMLGNSLTLLQTHTNTQSSWKLEKSVSFLARTFKFGLQILWTLSQRLN